MSLWLLKNLDTETMTLKTPFGEVLQIKDVDANLAFGIPFSGLQVNDYNHVKVGSKVGPKYHTEVVNTVRKLLFNKSSPASFTVRVPRRVTNKRVW